jgi:hypothetical protein
VGFLDLAPSMTAAAVGTGFAAAALADLAAVSWRAGARFVAIPVRRPRTGFLPISECV